MDYCEELCCGSGWRCCHGVCAYLFSIPQINPFFPRAPGDAARVVVREGPHLSKHETQAQLGEGCAEVFMTLRVLSTFPVTTPAPCHLFIQTLKKPHGLLPCSEPWEYPYRPAGSSNSLPASLAEFPTRCGPLSQTGRWDSEQRIGNHQLESPSKVTQGGVDCNSCSGYLLWV